jgi:hypothetical protein
MGPQADLILQTTGRSVLVQMRIQLSPIPAEMFQASAYIRVTVIDTNDHRAWSNPIWLN